MASPLHRKEVLVFTPEHWYGLNVPLTIFEEHHLIHLSDDYVMLAVIDWNNLSALVKANVKMQQRKEGE